MFNTFKRSIWKNSRLVVAQSNQLFQKCIVSSNMKLAFPTYTILKRPFKIKVVWCHQQHSLSTHLVKAITLINYMIKNKVDAQSTSDKWLKG